MGLRLAFGPCSCRKPYGNRIQEMACGIVEETLAGWRDRLPQDLAAFPTEQVEKESIEGYWVTRAMHKHARGDVETLLVVEVFVSTWAWPTFFAFGAIGRLYVEGLLVRKDGTVRVAPDETMWAFR